MTDTLQVVTATSSKEEAETIARALIERRLAACVQVAGPITSTYHWKGRIESAQEFLCIIKTRESHYLALEDAIRELHSYEVPEILAFQVSAGNRAYLDWLRRELADLSGPDVV
ncbi:MAG: divalent-cation tolerance protein CutA [Planctomycetia bacterium]|nr:divalent-cation tolerance protein CutA [Planctomycetia bacterium]